MEGVKHDQGTCILDEAKAVVNGDRQNDYGPPEENLERIRRFWEVLFGVDIPLFKVPLAMDLVKTARLIHNPKRDGYVDKVGYTLLAERLDDREARQEACGDDEEPEDVTRVRRALNKRIAQLQAENAELEAFLQNHDDALGKEASDE